MAGDTVITVVGNLTADPELRFTPSVPRSRTSPSRPRPGCSTVSPMNGKTARLSSCAATFGVRQPRTWPRA